MFDEARSIWKLHVKTPTGEETLEANGLFYAIGHDPATALVKGQLDTDSEGYVLTKPGTTLTSVEGVFAAGDCTCGGMQVVTAAGEGAMAAMEASAYIKRGNI